MIIDVVQAATVLREEAARAQSMAPVALWVKKLEELDALSVKAARTAIAAFGTALLAKSTDREVDVFSLKVGEGGHRAYSARNLAKEVLAALAPELEIDIGTYGREPLNNQPYFRESRITRNMPVRPNARPALNCLVDLLGQIDKLDSEAKARELLRTYITVRRAHFRRPGKIGAVGALSPSELQTRVEAFTSATSEGGKRAQAVVAGLLDASLGSDVVQVGRINDPDTSLPGDVAILKGDGTDGWHQVFEVRDKPVAEHDLHHLINKVAHAGVDRVAMVAISRRQLPLDARAAVAKAGDAGIELSLRIGWGAVVGDAVFWGKGRRATFAAEAVAMIDERLVELEAKPATVAEWRKLNGA